MAHLTRSAFAAALLAVAAGCESHAVVQPPAQVAPVVAPQAPRSRLDVVRIDDGIDPFARLSAAQLPDGTADGIAILALSVGTRITHTARVVFRPGEARPAAVARLQAWLATFQLPAGARFGFEDLVDQDAKTGEARVMGVRTVVLVGDSVLRPGDVTQATAAATSGDLGIAVTLSPDAAQRFEAVTREWAGRRLAIAVDDVIESSPRVMGAIPGGHIHVSLAGTALPGRLREAEQLAKRLSGG